LRNGVHNLASQHEKFSIRTSALIVSCGGKTYGLPCHGSDANEVLIDEKTSARQQGSWSTLLRDGFPLFFHVAAAPYAHTHNIQRACVFTCVCAPACMCVAPTFTNVDRWTIYPVEEVVLNFVSRNGTPGGNQTHTRVFISALASPRPIDDDDEHRAHRSHWHGLHPVLHSWWTTSASGSKLCAWACNAQLQRACTGRTPSLKLVGKRCQRTTYLLVPVFFMRRSSVWQIWWGSSSGGATVLDRAATVTPSSSKKL
jgi:hypothetical protein